MKRTSTIRAFTLVEMLAIIALVAVLVAIMMPGKRQTGPAFQVRCMNNQKQIAAALILWQWEHNDRLLGQSEGGDRDSRALAAGNSVAAWFLNLSNYIGRAGVFACPADAVRPPATNFIGMRNENISYFLSLDAATNSASRILIGDRNLEGVAGPVKSGCFIYSNGVAMAWTVGFHSLNANRRVGLIAFADGHVEPVPGRDLTGVFQRQELATDRLVLP